MNNNEIKLLKYLIERYQRGHIIPKDPQTHIPYSQALSDLKFPDDKPTPGESLNHYAMAGLAKWLKENNLPAITGVIINKLNQNKNAIRQGDKKNNIPGTPSKSYFTFHGREPFDFPWQQEQIKNGCNTDWDKELAARGIHLNTDMDYPDDVPERLKEGAKKTIIVNAYERSFSARNKCIKHHKCICFVCKFNFEEAYGDLGKGFIHVHHIIPISDIGEEYEVDPINHLRPVCPNCHAMLHRMEDTNDKDNISELKEIIEFERAKKKR